ncbi:MAG: hypothetical protein M1814_006040 [Vezdaea aestivalis]|nr:MAG: hypothetical protein M1814_006040 [Vezdaea aestivalis]
MGTPQQHRQDKTSQTGQRKSTKHEPPATGPQHRQVRGRVPEAAHHRPQAGVSSSNSVPLVGEKEIDAPGPYNNGSSPAHSKGLDGLVQGNPVDLRVPIYSSDPNPSESTTPGQHLSNLGPAHHLLGVGSGCWEVAHSGGGSQVNHGTEGSSDGADIPLLEHFQQGSDEPWSLFAASRMQPAMVAQRRADFGAGYLQLDTDLVVSDDGSCDTEGGGREEAAPGRWDQL